MTAEKVDFDNYAEQYEKQLAEGLKFFGEDNSYFADYKINIIKNTIDVAPERILEYGCGIGRNIEFFSKYFPGAKVYGCDISQKSLEIAGRTNPKAGFFKITDEEINGHSDSFDLIFISCVFHHIEPALRTVSMNNVYKLLKEGGNFFFFEHNPYNPVTQRIVNTCPWDTDAILLKPKESFDLISKSGFNIKKKKYTLFFPSFLKFLRPLENVMWFLPLGGQYYIHSVK